MRLLLPVLVLVTIITACTSSTPDPPLPTSTPYPAHTPYPTPEPAGAAFLEALQARIEVDDTIPLVGREAIIALIGGQPTYAFIEDPGLVLQYNAALPQAEEDIEKAAVLLMGTSLIMAGVSRHSTDRHRGGLLHYRPAAVVGDGLGRTVGRRE